MMRRLRTSEMARTFTAFGPVDTVRRALLRPDGSVIFVRVRVCKCAHGMRRGPVGGVCGHCGGGIPYGGRE